MTNTLSKSDKAVRYAHKRKLLLKPASLLRKLVWKRTALKPVKKASESRLRARKIDNLPALDGYDMVPLYNAIRAARTSKKLRKLLGYKRIKT